MADNVLITPKAVLDLALMSLGPKLGIARFIHNPEVQNTFGKPKNYKPGSEIQIRKPYRFVPQSGIGWDPQPVVDQVTPFVVNRVSKVHFSFPIVERTLSVREAMRLYGDPISDALSADINAQCATFCANKSLGSVGTPGTAPTGVATYLAAGDVLAEMGLPNGRKPALFVNRRMSSAYVTGTTAFFNPAGAISKQYNQGEMQDALGYDVRRDQTINTHINGAYSGTPLINGANQVAAGGNNATMSLITDGWGSGVTSLKAGDKFVIGSATDPVVGGVMSCDPQTRQSTGRQQVFTVEQDISDTTGAITMVIAPAITPATLGLPDSQYANVNISPVNDAIITVIGATGVSAQQGLLLDEKAFAFVSVPLAMNEQGSGVKQTSSTDDETNITMVHTCFSNGENLDENHRYDVLWDIASLYREMGIVVQA